MHPLRVKSVSRPAFPTTQWGRVQAAGGAEDADSRAALAELCRDYWYPLYAFIRRKGHNPEDAADLVQGLFASLLERRSLKGLEPARGRFRSFLMTCCNNYLANRYHYDRADKRGGGQPLLSIDRRNAEGRYINDPSHDETPDRIYDRQWTLTLLDRVLQRLDKEVRRSRNALLYERLRPLLGGSGQSESHRRIAEELGLREGAVRSAAYRLRVRYSELLREEVSRTLGPSDDVEEEINDLLNALGG